MNYFDFPQIVSFIIETEKLKSISRKTKVIGTDRYENPAEHSWQICLLASLLLKDSPVAVDVQRVLEILLVHDIPEIEIGDQIVYQAKTTSYSADELRAAQKLFGLLPDSLAHWGLARWQEYEDRKTPEAIYAYAIDRLMPLLLNLHNEGQSWRENKISLAQVLKVNAVIDQAFPQIWEHIVSQLKNHFDA